MSFFLGNFQAILIPGETEKQERETYAQTERHRCYRQEILGKEVGRDCEHQTDRKTNGERYFFPISS